MKIEYDKVGDYYFPKLKVEDLSTLSNYGRMKLRYLKEYEQPFYFNLLVKGKLKDDGNTVRSNSVIITFTPAPAKASILSSNSLIFG